MTKGIGDSNGAVFIKVGGIAAVCLTIFLSSVGIAYKAGEASATLKAVGDENKKSIVNMEKTIASIVELQKLATIDRQAITENLRRANASLERLAEIIRQDYPRGIP